MGVRPSVTFLTATSNVNNSVIFHRRTVPKVANERYCYIFFIFGEGWGKGVKGGPLGGTKKKRKTKRQKISDPKFFSDQNFFSERYCYIFFIFGVGWGKGVKGGPLGCTKKKRKTKKKKFRTQNFFQTKFFFRTGIAIYLLFLGWVGV